MSDYGTINGLEALGGRLPNIWGRRGFWQVRLRWAVAPLMITGIVIGIALGFEIPVVPILLIALASPIYNACFAWIFARYRQRLEEDPALDRLVTVLEIITDYAAMFLLIYFTGGVSSPLTIFLIFHVIISAIQFRPRTAYWLAATAAGGLWLLLLAQVMGWCACDLVKFRGLPISLMDRPVYAAVVLLFYTATFFLTAAMVARIMATLRQRVGDLARVTEELARTNDKLHGLYGMITAMGAERHMEPVLAKITAELAKATDVPAVAVKLLSEDGLSLRYVAAYGLPDELTRGRTVYLTQSPLNRRILAGETIVEASTDAKEGLQLHRELGDLGIHSAVLTPLKVDDRIIGTLGFYSGMPDHLQEQDAPFLQLAAELVAIAIDDARAFDAIENLMRERTEFMLEVAHNLRAPLGASVSIVDLLRGGYSGKLSDQQAEQLTRLDTRLRALDQTIGELLAIARTRDRSREIPDVVVDLEELAERTDRTFRGSAESKGITLDVRVEEDLPMIESGASLLEQLMENLVSNAIKYTPEGGSVDVAIARGAADSIHISVSDTGIGIPDSEQDKLFRPFFRASNAKKMTTNGTGLGLALVRQTVDRHRGRIRIESHEDKGTRVEIELPVRGRQRSADPGQDLQ
jgi:signal transduction histidine kinase